MYMNIIMGLGFRHILLIFLFVLGQYSSVTAESENSTSQRLITAPLKETIGSVIDGTNLGEVFNSDTNTDELHGKKGGNSRVSVTTVALFTLAMAAATGLGALPFFFVEIDAQWEGICNGMAAGVMLAASFDLIQEGRDHGSGNWVVMGILSGGIFILMCKKVSYSSTYIRLSFSYTVSYTMVSI